MPNSGSHTVPLIAVGLYKTYHVLYFANVFLTQNLRSNKIKTIFFAMRNGYTMPSRLYYSCLFQVMNEQFALKTEAQPLSSEMENKSGWKRACYLRFCFLLVDACLSTKNSPNLDSCLPVRA